MSLHPAYLDKKQKAAKIVERYIIYSIGAGLVPIPLVDTLTIAGLQFAMIKQLSHLYEVDFKEHRAKSVVAALLGSIATTASFYKFIPVIGIWIGGLKTSVIGGVYTYALGKVFTLHFDQGGTLLDFDPATSRAFFKQELAQGRKLLQPKKYRKKRQKQLLKQLAEERKQLSANLSQLQKELRNFNTMQDQKQF